MAIGPVPAPMLPGALEAATTQMAGMTADQAYNEFIDDSFDVSGDVKIGFTTKQSATPPAVSGNTSNTIVDSNIPTAVDAWNDYVENEVPIVSDKTGGVVDGSNVQLLTYSILDTIGDPEAVTPVAVPLDVGIVAAAQALGVSMDAAELDVQTKQVFANSVANANAAIYDKARNLITVWKDKLGNILFPKSVVDAVESAITELGIGPSNIATPPEGYMNGNPDITFTDISHVVFPISYGNYVALEYECTPAARMFRNIDGGCVLSAESPITRRYRFLHSNGVNHSQWSSTTFGNTITYNEKTARYGVDNGIATWANSFVEKSNVLAGENNKGAWSVLFGYIAEGGYPEGTSKSEAPVYTSADLESRGNIMGEDGERVPVVPINIPDDPYNSTGSTTDPQDPTADDNPGVVNPPIPLPIPDTKPSNPDVPLVNPSVIDSTRINELVEELANTLDPQPGQSSGIIPVPPLPGITDPETGQTTFPSIIPDSGPGFIHVYNPTPAEFVAFGSWLWVTYADATIDKILNNPFDGVIGAHELYATPNRGGTDNIRSAFLVCPTTAALVPNRYSEIDCGTVIVPEFYGNYLDYSPYSQAYIYLPFIGINEVSIDDIVGHAVNIRYRVDSYSGSCIAMIFVAKDGYQNLCYQFAGSCSVEVPMAGGSQAAIKAGMMQAEAYARAAMTSAVGHLFGGIGSALMGSLGGTLSSIGGIANDYANAKAGVEAARVANKSSVQHSGQFGASHGAMGQKIPFIIIRNPIQVKVVNYNDDYGFPAHKRVIIGGCTGYLRVREVNVISAHATDDEKAAIEALLKNGVYVS